MGDPSSQIITTWVKEDLNSPDWFPLKDAIFSAIQKKLSGWSESECWDLVEARHVHVAEHLREELSENILDGAPVLYEIDDELPPYVRSIDSGATDLLEKLRRIDPFVLEDVCARILEKLGASAWTTPQTHDGGIDFIGIRFGIAPNPLAIPLHAQMAVIGQTKRYKDGSLISETDIRAFVGASVLCRQKMISEDKIRTLTPVALAFWTTSDFNPAARTYCRNAGLWYMNGQTLAAYTDKLGLRDFIMALPDCTASEKTE